MRLHKIINSLQKIPIRIVEWGTITFKDNLIIINHKLITPNTDEEEYEWLKNNCNWDTERKAWVWYLCKNGKEEK